MSSPGAVSSPPPPGGASAQRSTSFDRAARLDRIVGLSIVAVAFAAALAISWWAKKESRPELSEPPAPPTIEGLNGFPTAVDPVEAFALARTLTKRNRFLGFVAEGVKSDGTIDVTKDGRVWYEFQSRAGEGPQPPWDPEDPKRRVCGRQRVTLGPAGVGAEVDEAETPCPKGGPPGIPRPKCNTRAVWSRAIAKGAPRKKLARIEYYKAKAGAAWRFEIPGTNHQLVLNADCKRELTAKESIQASPG